MIHLDTSFLIRAMAAGTPEDLRLRQWLASGEALGISPFSGSVLGMVLRLHTT